MMYKIPDVLVLTQILDNHQRKKNQFTGGSSGSSREFRDGVVGSFRFFPFFRRIVGIPSDGRILGPLFHFIWSFSHGPTKSSREQSSTRSFRHVRQNRSTRRRQYEKGSSGSDVVTKQYRKRISKIKKLH